MTSLCEELRSLTSQRLHSRHPELDPACGVEAEGVSRVGRLRPTLELCASAVLAGCRYLRSVYVSLRAALRYGICQLILVVDSPDVAGHLPGSARLAHEGGVSDLGENVLISNFFASRFEVELLH